MNFIRCHWFGLSVSLVVFFFLCVFALVLAAPHQDEQKRGFVPCTEKMAEELHNCNGRKMCVLERIVDNTFCNIGVIGEGIKLWATGKQSAPWSNYLFVPDIKRPSATDGVEAEESLAEYYESSPDIGAEMDELYELNQQLEKMQDEK